MENTCILLKIIKEYNGAFRERVYNFLKNMFLFMQRDT